MQTDTGGCRAAEEWEGVAAASGRGSEVAVVGSHYCDVGHSCSKNWAARRMRKMQVVVAVE